jgi:hypothetical protein
MAVSREAQRRRHLIAAGVCLGLAVAAKWSGLYLALFYGVVAGIQMVRRRAIRQPAAALAGVLTLAAFVFLMVNPLFPAYFADYRDRFLLETRIQRFGHVGRVQDGWLDYLSSSTPACDMPWLSTSLLFNMGPLLAGCALAGVLFAFRRRAFVPALHAVYVLLYLLLTSAPGHVKTPRYLAPILPSLFLLAAWLVDGFCARPAAPRRRLVFAVAGALLLAVPLGKSVSFVARARRPTTCERAEAWIRAKIPPDAGLFVSPFFLNNLDRLPNPKLYLAEVGTRQARLPGDPRANAELAPIYHPAMLDGLRAEGVRYVVTNSWFDDFFLPFPENRRWFPRSVEAYAAWRRRLAAESRWVWSIRARDAGCLGPDIEVYRLSPAGAADRR